MYILPGKGFKRRNAITIGIVSFSLMLSIRLTFCKDLRCSISFQVYFSAKGEEGLHFF